ncbi:MAG: hypothetical protein IJP29_04080 [Lachnospiraceae bacterium]|nr:hypothetical protein [Lachnospiraceae bacterium]
MRKLRYKKIIFLISVLVCASLCSGCSISKTYYSKGKIKRLTKALVSKDVEYIGEDMVEDYKVFCFEDSEGRPFSVFSYSEHIPLYNSSFPLYTAYVADTYQVSVFQHEREEIQKILNESGLEWTELTAVDVETQQVDMMKLAKGGSSLHAGINHGKPIEKEDLKVIAKVGAEIDGILHYEYDKEVDTNLAFQRQHIAGIRIVFCDDEDTYLFRDIEVPFSTSKDDRWTEKGLYAHLLDAYEEYEKEMRIYEETPDKVVAHMEKKYGTEFVCDKDLGVSGTIGSPLRDNQVEVVLYEKTDENKEFQIRVTVYGTAHDGMFTYEDDYQDIMDFKEFNRKCQEEFY